MGRSQTAPCLQCRYRKVRCDRQQDTCGNCERLEFSCSYRRSVSCKETKKQKNESVPPERQRAGRACSECRRQKARCSGDLPSCKTCRHRQRACRYTDSDLAVDSSPLRKSASALFPIRRQELLRAIDQFFRHLYPIPSFAFLHEPSVRQHCLDGILDQSLALSLAAVTNAYLSTDQRLLQECASWMLRAEAENIQHLHQPSIRRVQTLLLTVHYYIRIGEFARAYMLVGLAARAATALRLNYERPELTFVAQETRRRVIWALTSIDGYFSVGLPEHETISYAIIYQRWPCHEEEFSDGNPQRSTGCIQNLTKANPAKTPNLLSACHQISKIQRDVMRLTRQLAISEEPLAALPGLVQEIQNDLWRLHDDVELTSQFSISTMTRQLEMKHSQWFARYLLVALSWHQVHCDLYRIFLPGYPEAVPSRIMNTTDANVCEHAVRMCHTHVMQVTEILAGVLSLSDTPVLPHYVAVCAYQSARLILFLPSLHSSRPEIATESAIRSANLALSVLHTFFSSTPFAERIITDLEHLVQASVMAPATAREPGYLSSAQSDSGRQRHSQLAVHSLVRQAKFEDDDYES
ncbi:hypothetical protein NUH16_005245 [Penicillium rubens]|uniref:uncharacterized protein n=1 Tax=Penicillium rubens TaxID=1108849 RepID=UPI002A59D3F6|nr:uncharacterized protein N7525_002270 [Penicillium rubens]KAJ5033828.1 hypothetical protein NUH16_005245 [Penicillium rubens]KAJ5844529.1 hypothetical protein N7525_002270 [Penicillium rubens]KAJ5844879.1 hypothetical protein N7534_008548 [Penicillium rubens]